MQKIVITGPESSGKTTLAVELCVQFKDRWVPEYARYYLNHLKRSYDQSDLSKIGKGQLEIEASQIPLAERFLFCDTDLLTIYIWSMHKYGSVDPWIEKRVEQRHYDLYLLCRPDIPWTADPQREHPNQRSKLFEEYERQLQKWNKPYAIIEGEQRLETARGLLTEISE